VTHASVTVKELPARCFHKHARLIRLATGLSAGTSFLNRTEAANVEKIVTRFLQNGVTPAQIGVITPYEGQRAHIMTVMGRTGTLRSDLYADIEVSSVDAFQVCVFVGVGWDKPLQDE
jgi:superfamily I DNA and/or RNA helicase